MPSTAVESLRSSSLRYERGHSGSASFAAQPRDGRRRSRSASRRCEGGACSAGNRAGTQVPDAALGTVAALRCAHLGIQRRPPDSVERAAPSKCCALKQASGRPGPSGTRARKVRAVPLPSRSTFAMSLGAGLDTTYVYSYVASNLKSDALPFGESNLRGF